MVDGQHPDRHRQTRPNRGLTLVDNRKVIEVIDLILDFIVPPSPHQIGRVWRHQSLRITARLGEDRETPGSCMAHYPTDHRRGVSAGTASVGGYK